MNDLERLRRLWQTAPGAQDSSLGKEDLVSLIEGRAADVRRGIRRHLRRDAMLYLALVALPLVSIFDSGMSARNIAFLGLMAATTGTLGVALELQARRLRSVELSTSLRDALKETLERLTASIRLYMALYMVVIVGFLGILVGLVFWRFPGQPIPDGAAVLGALGLGWWSYASGRNYLRRGLGRYRAPLEAALRDLTGAATDAV
jgi:hypothetical protein